MPLSLAPTPRRAFHFLIFSIGIVCICLVAAQPFLQERMPRTDDGLLQMYRGAALHHALRVDHPLWPRFASGLVYGYGAPLFNYFPPLSYFPATWLRDLGFGFVGGWQLSMVLYTLLAALGIFLLARLWTRSDLAGWLAALAYVYAPFFLFDSLTRGSSPELAALAALPFVMVAFTRLAWAGRRRDLVLATLSFALFIPLHTLITLHGTALLALYCLFLLWRAAAGKRRAVFARLTLAGALGLALTAFYWLPALVEADAIKLGLINEQLSHIDVKAHLRPLSALLAGPHRADPSQQNQAIPISLGWLQLALAALALLLSARRANRPYLSLLLLIWGMTLALLFMNTPASAPVWDAVPLIAFTQFPWRLLGLASLLLALAAGIGAHLLAAILPPGKIRAGAVGLLGALLVLYALPWTYRAYHDILPVEDMRDAQRFERAGGQLALSSYAEYLPRSADADQLDALRLVERYDTAHASAAAIARLLPSDALEIQSQRWTGTSASLRLVSAREQTLVFDWLYVPGWRAQIDGRMAPVYASAPAGLAALDVPVGAFDLRIALEATPAQSAAQLLSAAAALGFLALIFFWRRLPWLQVRQPESADSRLDFDWRLAAAFAALGLGLFLAKALVLDSMQTSDMMQTPFQTKRFGSVAAAPALANFAHQIDLLAADLPTKTIEQPLVTVKLYWRLHDEKLDRDYASALRLRDPWGELIAEASSYAPGGLATSNWRENAYIEDRITLEIPPFTPPLDEAYRLEAALFDVGSLQALSVINAAGNPEGAQYQLTTLLYRPPASPIKLDETLTAQQSTQPALLRQAPELPPRATVGDELRFSWTWRKTHADARGLAARLLWLAGQGQVAYESRALPLVRGYDIARWRLGEDLRGHQRLTLPPDLPAGTYALALQLLDAAGMPSGQAIDLGAPMAVAVPPRQFDAPAFAETVAAQWHNGIVLHGYTFASASGTLELETIWGTLQTLPHSLRLFTHILDESDDIAAQWDGVPADWTRPTSGWLPGEYISQRQRFALPAGQYRLRLGWYDPLTGERLRIGDDDALQLTSFLSV